MKIVFYSGTPYLPQVRGGVEINTHELATELVARGHAVSVLTRLSYRDAFGIRMQLTQGLWARGCSDRALGYQVLRARAPDLLVGDMPRPDVVVIQNGHPKAISAAFARRGVPVVAYLHGLGFQMWPRQADASGDARLPISAYLSISEFTARRFEDQHGLKTSVIPPVHRPERYRAKRDPRYVTLINPVAVKGVDIALQVAAMLPNIPFQFVKGWPLGFAGRRRLRAQLKARPNVILVEPSDMRDVYGVTRILLAPSQWEAETWGRVATEAHFSGIPVVASDRGGLPESVGPGGVILGVDEPAEKWAAIIERLWSDHSAYDELSSAALAYSRRSAISIDEQISAFERFLESAASAGHLNAVTSRKQGLDAPA
jgi:glycosyltransferase involved in cell wall biosynthesis